MTFTKVNKALITSLELGKDGRWRVTLEVDGKDDARCMAFHIGETVTFTIKAWERVVPFAPVLSAAASPAKSTVPAPPATPSPSAGPSLQLLITEAYIHVGRTSAALARSLSKHTAIVIRSQQVGSWISGYRPVPEAHRDAIVKMHAEVMATPEVKSKRKPGQRGPSTALTDEEAASRAETLKQVLDDRFKRRADLAGVLSKMEGRDISTSSVDNWALGRAPIPDRWWKHILSLAAAGPARTAAKIDPATAPAPARKRKSPTGKRQAPRVKFHELPPDAPEKAPGMPSGKRGSPAPTDAEEDVKTPGPDAPVKTGDAWGGPVRRISKTGWDIGGDFPEGLRLRDEMRSALKLAGGDGAARSIGRRNAVRVMAMAEALKAGLGAPAEAYPTIASALGINKNVVASLCKGRDIDDHTWSDSIEPVAMFVLAGFEAAYQDKG